MTGEKSTKSFAGLGDLMGHTKQPETKTGAQKNKSSKKKKRRKKSPKNAEKVQQKIKRTFHIVKKKITHQTGSIFGDEPEVKKEMTSELKNKDVEEILNNLSLLHLRDAIDPSTCSVEDLADYNERLTNSGYGFVSSNGNRILVLGIDFGSTCSKVVARFPYETIGEKPEAIPALNCTAVENNPYYWKSEIFLNDQNEFSLVAHNSIKSFSDLKISFIKRAESGVSELTDADIPLIAYLTLITKQAAGWVGNKHKIIPVSDVKVELNFGFPVESFQKTASLEKFEKAVRIASSLAETRVAINFENVSKIVARSSDELPSVNTQFTIIPEIVAAVTGFANSSESRRGEYIIIDIGGLSIDFAFFSIREYPDNGQINFGIASAGSKKHGVEILRNSGLKDIHMQNLLLKHISVIIKDAYEKISYNDVAWRDKELNIFLTGGGRDLNAYKQISYRLNLIRKTGVFLRPTSKKDIHRFHGLNHELVEDRIPNRLVIAYGLSFPAFEIPEWYTPDQYTPVQQNKLQDFTTSYIGPEQV